MSEDRDFRAWKVTSEQADKIARGDREEATAFYLRNKARLRKMAHNYASSHNFIEGVYYDPEDMMSQLFIDLPNLNWKDGFCLNKSVNYCSFAWSVFGGFTQRKEAGEIHTKDPFRLICDTWSLDEPVSDDSEATLGDFVPVPYEETPEAILLSSEDPGVMYAADIVERLSSLLTGKEAKFLELFLSGVSLPDIASVMGVKGITSFKVKLLDKLRSNYLKVNELLPFPKAFTDIIPEGYEKAMQRAEAIRISKKRSYVRNREAENARRRERRRSKAATTKARVSP